MNQEQFQALLAGLTVATLVNKKVYGTLTPEQQSEYDTKAAAVAASFRTANPDGKDVEFAVETINPTDRGYAIVVAKNAKSPSRNNVFQFASPYVDNMAKRIGLHNGEILSQVHAGSLDDNFFKTTFVVAIKGEKFVNRASGAEEVYTMTTLRNVNDAIVLGDDARGLLKDAAKDALRQAAMGNKKAVNRGRITEPDHAEPVVEAVEEQL